MVKCNRCGHNAGASHTWDACYKKTTHTLTVPWFQSTTGKTAIVETHTKVGYRPSQIGDIDPNFKAFGKKSNSSKGGGHYSNGRDKDRNQGFVLFLLFRLTFLFRHKRSFSSQHSLSHYSYVPLTGGNKKKGAGSTERACTVDIYSTSVLTEVTEIILV